MTSRTCRVFLPLLMAASVVPALVASLSGAARQVPNASVGVDRDDIGGVVSSPNGPEAGVWVIAETDDLPTKFAKIVVTDDRGRYLVPDLPNARYSVWVRGYGLVDSPRMQVVPGVTLDLRATAAPNAAAAAQYLPAHLLVLDDARASGA